MISTPYYLTAPDSSRYTASTIPGVNAEADDTTRAEVGYLRLWEEVPVRPGPYYDLVRGNVLLDDTASPARYTRTDSWQEWDASRKRGEISFQIFDQVQDATGRDRVRDPKVDDDISRAWGAMSVKEAELSETADPDLNTFDPTLDISTPQDDTVGYSELAITILQVDPWVGAPDNNVGWQATLYVKEGLEAQGGEARLSILGPVIDGPLPFVQDSTDPRLWVADCRDGFKWSDPNAVVQAQLRWGSGSLLVTGTLACNGLYDRVARIVRYGLP